MKHELKIALSSIGACLLCTSVVAQSIAVPDLINYQGRLTSQTGAPLASGTYAIQFRLWDQANNLTANNLIWAQQQNTVAIGSNGVFNVMLGDPGGIPISGAAVTDLTLAFGATNRFLGLTVISSNGVVISNPSEILPRQQFLTVPFAVTALNAANATNAMVAASVLPGSITAASLAPGSVTTASLAPGSVQAADLAPGSVAQSNLAPRPTGTTVPAGGVAISGSSGNFSVPFSFSTSVPVPNLTVTITTTGRPVHIGLLPDGSQNRAILAGTYSSTFTSQVEWYCQITRDPGPTFASSTLFVQNSAQNLNSIAGCELCGAAQTFDFPPAGTHTYRVFVGPYNDTTTWPTVYASYLMLVVYEL